MKTVPFSSGVRNATENRSRRPENGRCDGNDIGSGTLNIVSMVVDPDVGAATLVDELRKNRLLRAALVAVLEPGEYGVVHPARFKGKFSLF